MSDIMTDDSLPTPKKPVTVVDKRLRLAEDDDAASAAAPDDGASAYPTVVAELETKLKQAQANFEAFKAQQQREYDAFRERAQRDAAQAGERRAGDLVKPFIDALDNLERAIAAADPATGEGLRLILAQLLEGLARAGCAKVATLGEKFDPASMEAVAIQPAPEPAQTGTVASEFSNGFKLGERVLRPARVVVYK